MTHRELSVRRSRRLGRVNLTKSPTPSKEEPSPRLPRRKGARDPEGSARLRPRSLSTRPARPPSPPRATASAGARRRQPHSSSVRSSRAMCVLLGAQRSQECRGRGRGGAFFGRGVVTSRRAPGCPTRCLLQRVGGALCGSGSGAVRPRSGRAGAVGPGGGTSVTLCRVVKGDGRARRAAGALVRRQLGLGLCIPEMGPMLTST